MDAGEDTETRLELADLARKARREDPPRGRAWWVLIEYNGVTLTRLGPYADRDMAEAVRIVNRQVFGQAVIVTCDGSEDGEIS